MSRANLFTIGAMTGIVVVLFAALVVQQPSPAYGQTAMGESGSGLVVATGGLQSSTNDLFWVLYKRRPTEAEMKLLGKNFNEDRLSLCTYRVVGGGSNGHRLVLIAARDITYDLKMIGMDAETIASVKDIKKKFEEALKKAETEK